MKQNKQKIKDEVYNKFYWRIKEVKAIADLPIDVCKDIRDCVNTDFKILIQETAKQIFEDIEKLEEKGTSVHYQGKIPKKYVYKNQAKGIIKLSKVKELKKKWVKQ